ncbi:MAG TPA: sigma-70 family RNA polymerase sigma factor [Actinomycetota bacterium]|nr:sigma-70 family RNA polymerase sigma factor [Actinomycetota bacterium]
MEASAPLVSSLTPRVPRELAGPALPGGMGRAFDDLFVAEYPVLVGIASRVLGDRAEAEDVAQEVFLAFHRNHSPMADYAPAWLHRAAWHTALNKVRGRRRRIRRELADQASVRVDAWADDPQALVEAAFDRAFDARRVRAAIGKLPPRAAGVLALRYSGLSYAEVAQAMGIGVGQVGTVLRRAEARLKREVESL